MSMKAARHPLIAVPLVLVGAMVYTHHNDQAASLAHTVGQTYGTTAGVAVGAAPDIIDSFSSGLNAMASGTAAGGPQRGAGGSVTPNGPVRLAPAAPNLAPVLR